MNNPVRSLIALSAFACAALFAQAQNVQTILVVDMVKLYDSHYRTEEQNAKLRTDEQKAQEELDRLNKEGNSLVEQYKEYVDQANNPATTPEAKQKAMEAAQAKGQEIQKKQAEVQSFTQNTQNTLRQRVNTFKSVMLEDISKIAVEIAKKKGASLLIDKSGPSLIGVPAVVYSAPGLDITEEVAAEINKSRPAPTASTAIAPAAFAPAAPAAPAKTDSPAITVPAATKK